MDFQQEKQKEIMIVAKAKGVNEDEIWKMGRMAYWNMLQVLEKYSIDLKENNVGICVVAFLRWFVCWQAITQIHC